MRIEVARYVYAGVSELTLVRGERTNGSLIGYVSLKELNNFNPGFRDFSR